MRSDFDKLGFGYADPSLGSHMARSAGAGRMADVVASKALFDGGSVGQAAAAAAYVASNIFSWKQAKDMPGLQARANREVLELQKEHYEKISEKQRNLLKTAVSVYLDEIDKIDNQLNDAMPNVPKAAPYVPVDACCVQSETIECNIGRTDRADDYVRYVNRLHEQNDLIHVLSMCPDFLTDLDIVNKSLTLLIRGVMPTGDVVEVLSDNAERAALTGRIGSARRTTARDLGISKLRLQAAGRKELRDTVAWMNTSVSPLQRQHDITEMMQRPAERIQLALVQAQLIQNALQNKNNQLALKDPSRLARLQLRMQKQVTRLQYMASRALLVDTHVPNYASIVVPKLDNTAQLLGGIGSAIQNANSSHFFGPPPQSQVGYDQNQPQQRQAAAPATVIPEK